MNWKFVATLLIGAVLVTACGSAQSTPAAAPPPAAEGSTTRSAQEEKADAPGGGAVAPGAQPAAVQPAKPTTDAKKDIIVHD